MKKKFFDLSNQKRKNEIERKNEIPNVEKVLVKWKLTAKN